MYKEASFDDKTKKQIIENAKKSNLLPEDVKVVDINDDIGFKCTHCGACCHDVNILLSPIDIYYMSKFLKIQPSELIDQYTKIDIGGQSGLPIVMVNKQENDMCIFHDFDIKTAKNVCKLGDSKPYTCTTAPFGTITTRNRKDGSSGKFIFLNNECGIITENTGITVGEYLKSRNNYPEDEKEESNELLTLLVSFCRLDKIMDSAKIIHEGADDKHLLFGAISLIISAIYIFKTDRTFMEQVLEHKRHIMYVALTLSKTFEIILDSMSIQHKPLLIEKNVREYIRKIFNSEAETEDYCRAYKIPNEFIKYW